jgi:hypothetical protein
MRPVERSSWQPGIVCVSLTHLDRLGQGVASNKAAREFNEMGTAFNAKDRAGGADPLAQQVQDTTWAATKVNQSLTLLDSNSVELGIGIGGEIGDLALEPLFLSFAATEQIDVWRTHRSLLSNDSEKQCLPE